MGRTMARQTPASKDGRSLAVTEDSISNRPLKGSKMFKKAKSIWEANKDAIIRRAVIYGGVIIGVAIVGLLAPGHEVLEDN